MTVKLGLRDWQLHALTQHIKLIKNGEKRFFYACDVGSGKTRIALSVFRASHADFLVVVVPKTGIRSSWTKEAKEIGLSLIAIECKHDFKSAMNQFPDGIVVTEGMLKSLAPALIKIAKKQKLILIGDEGHHLAEGKSWGNTIKSLMEKCFHFIGLSGTPDRNDKLPIVGLRYAATEDGKQAIPTYFYSHEQGVIDGVVTPVVIRLIGGSVTQTIHGVPITFDFKDDLDKNGNSMRLRTMLTCKDWQTAALELAFKQLHEYRCDGNPWAMLIACSTVKQSKMIHKILKGMGEKPMLIVGEDAETEKCVELFNEDYSYTCAITITKISEGVSIPRLRVGLMLTNFTSRTYFLQFRGRLVRLFNGIPPDNQYGTLFIAADPRLVEHANNSRQIMLHMLKKSSHDLPEFKKELDKTEKESSIDIGAYHLGGVDLHGASLGVININEADFQYLSRIYNKLDFVQLLQASAVEIIAILGALKGNDPAENFAIANQAYQEQKIPRLMQTKFYRLLVIALVSVFGDEAIKEWEQWLDRKPKGYWTLERIKESASKYKTKSEWIEKDTPAFTAAYKRGIIDECCAHMNGRNQHTPQSIKASAEKYKSRMEWKKNNGSTYAIAQRKGLLNECCGHMKPKSSKRTYTQESVKKSAQKYESRLEWQKKDPGSYQFARKRGWLDSCCAHMQLKKGKKS